MGRKTLDKVLSFPEWPYANKAVIVLSRQGVNLPEPLQGKVEVLAGEPADIVAQLAARGMKHLYIDGRQTVQAFLAAGILALLLLALRVSGLSASPTARPTRRPASERDLDRVCVTSRFG